MVCNRFYTGLTRLITSLHTCLGMVDTNAPTNIQPASFSAAVDTDFPLCCLTIFFATSRIAEGSLHKNEQTVNLPTASHRNMVEGCDDQFARYFLSRIYRSNYHKIRKRPLVEKSNHLKGTPSGSLGHTASKAANMVACPCKESSSILSRSPCSSSRQYTRLIVPTFQCHTLHWGKK